MLSPELEKLKRSLEGQKIAVNDEKLLDELKELDKIDLRRLCESLSLSSYRCSTCGRPF